MRRRRVPANEEANVSTGDVSGVGIAIGPGAQSIVNIFGNLNYFPVQLRAPLRAQFAPLIENLTSLFAGRAHEMARIADFLEDPAGGYLAITAPAGFGKSALAATLALAGGESLAYHFFSSMYDDGLSESFFLRNLVEQMAAWHERDAPPPFVLDQLRALYHDLLGEPLDRPRAILIDGLDEVMYWRLAPYVSRRLPHGLHVVFTLRDVGQDWRAQYQVPADQLLHLSLSGLTPQDVSEVLIAAGQRASAFASAAPLTELLRVARYPGDEYVGADPFYVRLLAEDAEAGELTFPDIAQRPAGLDAYLDGWWTAVRKAVKGQAAQDLIGTLTVTLGPIRRPELETLNDSLVDSWQADLFVEVLESVRRFVAGNNRTGYSLVHPRLRAYMRTRVQVTSYEDALINFCSQWAHNKSFYALSYYARHLADLGRVDELQRLFALEDVGGKNAWYEARRSTGDLDGYVSDLMLAWQSAQESTDDAIAQHNVAATVGDEVGYALLLASVNSLAMNTPSAIRVALVEHGEWTPDRAVIDALRIPDAVRASLALAALAPYLGEQQLIEALGAALAIASWIYRDNYSRMIVLKALAPYLPLDLLSDALEYSQQRSSNPRADFRGEGIAILAPRLPEALAADALDAARAIESPYQTAEALVGLTPHLPSKLQAAAFSSLMKTPDERHRADALVRLAPQLPAAQRLGILREVLRIIRRRDADETFRATMLVLMAPHAPPAMIPDMLSAAKALRDPDEQARALTAVAPRLPDEARVMMVESALSAAYRSTANADRAMALAVLASGLVGDERKAVLADALADLAQIPDDYHRANVIVELAPNVAPAHMPQLLAAATGLRDPAYRASTLRGLAPYLPDALVGDALAAAKALGYPHRASAVSAIVPRLSARQQADALKEIVTNPDGLTPYEAEAVLTALAPHLCDELIDDALAAVRALSHKSQTLNVLGALAPRLSGQQLQDGLAIAHVIGDEAVQAQLLISLLPHLVGDSRARAFDRVQLIADRLLDYPDSRLNILVALAPYASPKLAGEIVGAVRTVGEQTRAKWIFNLARTSARSLFDQLLAATLDLDERASEFHRAKTLAVLAPHATPEAAGQILSAAETLSAAGNRAHVIAALASRLTSPRLITRALAVASGLEGAVPRGYAVAALAPYLAETPRTEAVNSALDATSAREPGEQVQARAILAAHVTPGLREDALVDAIESLSSIGNEEERAAVIVELAPHLPSRLVDRALAEAQAIRYAPSRLLASLALAHHLSADQLTDALGDALDWMLQARGKGLDWSLLGSDDIVQPLASALERLPAERLRDFWRREVPPPVTYTRGEIFGRTSTLCDLMIALGGSESAAVVARWVLDVARWWP